TYSELRRELGLAIIAFILLPIALVPAAVFAVGLGWTVTAWRERKWMRREEEGRCGKCGYMLRTDSQALPGMRVCGAAALAGAVGRTVLLTS
ncbi:MAG: hypothetical protein ACREJC_07915, partial [Tepidisphaeraceae bacterium]